eukprot:CAMPEP_0175574090 /NCGR_PEP_ID=MMETSP0096-20121207/43874_1 /TAXON_ID=311494 /ORGANISM="Alexandrium monilatum, Strain CCMP3105" /LENGTH=43 /DNA_ID= /DNA_START= /DNA_END= /DNA_ORIENTATION=
MTAYLVQTVPTFLMSRGRLQWSRDPRQLPGPGRVAQSAMMIVD